MKDSRPGRGAARTDANRSPALAAWQRRWREQPESHAKRDLLWQLACLEAQAEELAAIGLHDAAAQVSLRARCLAAGESAA